ncbi:MAG: carbohydrate ABC transporter permease [Arachnia sp.]
MFLILTTLGAGGLAWRQYQELIALRASSLNNDERADLQKRLWAAEKRKHELEASLADKHDGSPVETPDGPEEGPPGGRRGGNRNTMANNFIAMMDKPEIQKLMAIQQRASLDAHYAGLFKSLNLSPAQLEQFKNLLVEKQAALTDALAAARAQGINPRTDAEDFQKLIASAQADADNNIKATLGDAGYAQYQQYQQTVPQRNVVNQLAQSLSYTSSPLSDSQSQQLVSILAANSLLVTLVVVAITMVVGFLAATAMARFNYVGRRFSMILILAIQMVPLEALLISMYVMLDGMGLLDRLMGVMVAYLALALPFTVWTLRGFISNIPAELEEAALIDGCSRVQSFRLILLPLIAPGLVAASVFAFILSWNEFILANVVLLSKQNATLPLWLASFQSSFKEIDWSGLMAASTLFALPVIVFFVAVQGRLHEGAAAGGVKG